ncbi:MAG: GGDEF domain-containing protein [Acidiferrobacteraceae bacterium]|jgi:diguanylate cyclase (GGDEF)-like protein
MNAKANLRIAVASFLVSAVVLAAVALTGLATLSVLAVLVAAVVIAGLTTMVLSLVGTEGAQAPAPVAPAAPDFSTTDPLTRTINRRGVNIAIMEAMALGERYGNPLSVTKIDLDGLKQVNDQFGKEVGDRVLAGVAAVITDALRMPDKVGRYDDDEFIVVMPQTRRDDAERIAGRLCSLIAEQEFDVDGSNTRITASVGVTQYHQDEDIEALLTRVQQGVDASRDAGRNRATAV